MTARALPALLLAVAGCTDDAPIDPTWAADVAPLLVTACGGCHGATPVGDAPTTFRLDVYDDVVAADGGVVRGAGTMAEFAAARADAGHGGLADDDRAVLLAWAARRAGATPPPRGARVGNRAPTLAARLGVPPPEGEPGYDQLPVAITITDLDREVVAGELRVVDGDAATLLRVGALHGGANALAIDSAFLRSGAYRLVANLGDASGSREAIVARLAVDHHGAIAPRVAVVGPPPGALVVDGDGPTLVQVRVTDLDSSTATLDVALRDAAPGGERVELATALPVVPGGITSLAYFPSEFAASDAWHVVATVTGTAGETFTTEGPAFAIRHDASADSFVAIRDAILGPRCGACHGPTPRIPGLDLDVTDVADVSAQRGAIYQRTIAQPMMPPPSAALLDPTAAPLTEAERARLAAWLGAGAPE